MATVAQAPVSAPAPPAGAAPEASGAVDDWSTALEVIEELKALYAAGDDVDNVKECHRLLSQIASTADIKMVDARHVIRGLAASVQLAKDSLGHVAPAEEHVAQMRELDAQRAALAAKLAALEQQAAASTGEVAKLRAQKEDVDARARAVEAEKVAQVPRLQYSMSLFANISKIKWDFAAYGDGGRVKGSLSVPGADDVRAFDLDPRALSDFDIANRLWDMLDGKA